MTVNYRTCCMLSFHVSSTNELQIKLNKNTVKNGCTAGFGNRIFPISLWNARDGGTSSFVCIKSFHIMSLQIHEVTPSIKLFRQMRNSVTKSSPLAVGSVLV